MDMHNPPHPGEMITDMMEELGIGIRELARALDVAASTVQRLVKMKIAVTPEMAIRLSIVLGGSPQFWLNLQDNHSLWQVSQTLDTTKLKRLAAV